MEYPQTCGAIIVLFDPSVEQIAGVYRLRQQCARVVVVDNTALIDRSLHAGLVRDGIDVIANRNLGGIAGAYNRGAEHLIANGCTVLLLLDQDSTLPEGYVETMLAASRSIATREFLLGPKIFDINLGRYLPSFRLTAHGAKKIAINDDCDGGLLPCSFLISSGTLLSVAAYNLLGRFREDYVIDHVDTEYCLRAAQRAVPMYLNPAIRMNHAIGTKVERRWLIFRLRAWNHSALRRYYFARNSLLLTRSYARRYPLIALINLLTLNQALAILLFETDKRKKLRLLLQGIGDGLTNRAGTYASLHGRPATGRSET